MPKDRDERTEKYTERCTPENFLSASESLGVLAGTQEVADEVGCAYRTAHAKLTELEEEENSPLERLGTLSYGN